MEFKIIKYDDTIVNPLNETEKTEYLLNNTAYSLVPFKTKKNPSSAWAMPYVTNHKYKVHWRYGLDFT